MSTFYASTLIVCATVVMASIVSANPPSVFIGVVLAAYLVALVRGVVSLKSQYFCDAVWRGTSGRPEVALTFDDGPDPASTPAILDLLAEMRISATFFVVGSRVRSHPRLAKRCILEGHLVENHSDRHGLATNFLMKGPMTRELHACNAAITQATGMNPRYYRPPVGLSNPATGPAAEKLGLTLVGWDARGFDGRSCDPDTVVQRILRRVQPGSIILLHDGGRDSSKLIAITTALLHGLKERGLSPVRLDHLLSD